jgi:protein SCO1/2
MRARTAAAFIAFLLLGAAAAPSWALWHVVETTPSAATAEEPLIRSEFELVDQDGRTVRGQDLHGRWPLVFFGFTACPDICPTTLTNVTAALEELGPGMAEKLQPILITVDPECDTPPVLKEYLSAFDPRILGLTGTVEQVETALKSFRVYAAKRPLEGEGYTMDHSTFIYLMDPEGAYATHFGAQTAVEDMTGRLREQLSAS